MVFFLLFFISFEHLFCSFLNIADIYNEKFKIALTYNYAVSEIKLQSIDSTQILLDINGKQFKYFDKVSTQYLTKIVSNSVIFATVINPFGRIKYNMELRMNTADTGLVYSKQLSSFTNSFGYGIGFGYTLFPQTLVTPGVLTSVKITTHKYNFDTLSIGNTYFKIDTYINVVDTSFSLLFTKMVVKNLELDCGCEISYRDSSIVDKTNWYKIYGNETLVKVIMNARIYLTKNEKISLGTVVGIGKEEYNIFGSLTIGW